MIMNFLNGAWSDIYILQIITQQKIRKVDRIYGDELDSSK